MARQTFGGRPGDFTVVDPATTSNIVTAAPSLTGGTVWSAKSGGTQYTDLLVGGSPVTTITTDSHGAVVAFQGPNNVSSVWVSFGGGTRVLLDAQGPYVLNSDAVGFSVATPAAGTYNGFAGSADSVNRSDHAHPLPPAKPGAVGLSTKTTPMHPVAAGDPGTLNRCALAPIYIMRRDRAPLVCTSIGVNVTAAGSAGATIRFGLWGANADGSIDTANLLFDSGEISTTSTGIKSYAYTTPIPEGLYWAGRVMHTAICTITQSVHGMVMQGGSPGQTDDKMYKDSITGALSTVTAPNIGGDNAPALFFTVA